MTGAMTAFYGLFAFITIIKNRNKEASTGNVAFLYGSRICFNVNVGFHYGFLLYELQIELNYVVVQMEKPLLQKAHM